MFNLSDDCKNFKLIQRKKEKAVFKDFNFLMKNVLILFSLIVTFCTLYTAVINERVYVCSLINRQIHNYFNNGIMSPENLFSSALKIWVLDCWKILKHNYKKDF